MSPYIYKGTIAKEGSGYAIVTCVGKNTNFNLSDYTDEHDNDDQSTLDVKLQNIVWYIGCIGTVCAILFFISIMTWLAIKIWVQEKYELTDPRVMNDALHALVTSVVILIMVIPEGLPLMKTLALQETMSHLNRDQIIIQQVDMVEKMACVKDLCVDKTGTLTNNDMNVVAVVCQGKPFEK